MQSVSEAQRDAGARLAAGWIADLSRLRAQTVALLDIRRAQALGAAHRTLLERGWLTADLGPEHDAFTRDLADAAFTGVLVDDVRSARLTPALAARFLDDYALAMRMHNGETLRAAMLEQLGTVAAEDALRQRVLEAMAAHAREAAALAAEHASSADLIAQWIDAPAWAVPADAAVTRDAWSAIILERITDPAQRSAAEELLGLLLPDRP